MTPYLAADSRVEGTPHAPAAPVRVGFVLHVMQVAGAEVLVAETIRRLGPAIEPVVLCLDAIGALGERVRAEGTDVVTLDRRPGLDWSVSRRMAMIIRERRLHVLHAHQYTPFFYGALAARLARAGTRVVFTEHGRHYPDVVSWKRRLGNRLILSRLADRITGVCEFSAKALAERDGFRSQPIEIIENGIDVDRYRPAADRAALKRRLGLDGARRHVVIVARFHPVKDHHTLLEAFAAVAASVDDVDLVLVGDGPLRGDLERQASALGIDARVRFLGVRRDVPELLAAADVFTLCSVSEAASITLLEAMATGTPVVATDVGGNPEIVRHRVDGLLTPRGDALALAAAIVELLNDPDLASTLGRHAAERARSKYQLKDTVDRYGSLYRALAGPLLTR
jgi:N-acetyl-alpha-D-glucosaminyl L-malate synthase BshA